MAGLDPAIQPTVPLQSTCHPLFGFSRTATASVVWMAGSSPAMTSGEQVDFFRT
jgi:hypothetical protein